MLLLLLISTVTLVVADVSHFEDQGYKMELLSTDSTGYPNEPAKLGMEVNDNGFIKSPGAGPRWIGGGAQIEAGAMVHQTAQIYGGATISADAMIGANAVVGGGAMIGRAAILGPGAQCEGGTFVGHHAILGPNARLGGGQVLPPYQVRL